MDITKKEKLTQAQRFALEFKKIEEDVTSEDREIIMQELNLSSRSTITKYLKGNPRNNDIAARMLTILKGRIAEREKAFVN